MDQKIQIKPTALNLVPGFHNALDAVAQERKYLMFLEAPPLEAVREFVSKLIQDNDIQFMALNAEGKVVGWCDIIQIHFPGFEHGGRLGMGIIKEYRGQGIGKMLMEKAITEARHRGLIKIELEVFASNIPAVNLYKKYGFKFEGLKRKSRYLDGNFDDVHLMALFLKDV
ncbi:GNAT family N-acetyltransferase [candidate division KSB1 bacterium]|nr:GNAT family N-acetyltransferase [candidate division KSB1 bacterium]